MAKVKQDKEFTADCEDHFDAIVDCFMHGQDSTPKQKELVGATAPSGDFDHNDPKYIKARRLQAGIMAIAAGAAMASGNQEAMDIAFLTTQIVNDHFDDYWAASHPKK